MVRPVSICPVLNGFIVTVGCQTVVFASLDQMLDELRKYYKDPRSTEKTYIANAVNPTMDVPCAVDRPRGLTEPRPALTSECETQQENPVCRRG